MAEEDRGHAILGGSKAGMYLACPGSISMQDGIPDLPVSASAEEGTAAHAICEHQIRNFLRCKAEGGEYDEYPHKPSDKEIESALLYVDMIWTKVLENSITKKAYGIEDLMTLNAEYSMFGYIDFWCIYIDDKGKRVGVIVDYKNGYHEVPVEKNPQLAFYACALREEIKAGGKDLDYVRTVVIQPYGESVDPADPDSCYKEDKITQKQLDAWKKKFDDVAYEIFVAIPEGKKPKLSAGSHCKYCKAQAICPEFGKSQVKNSSLALLDVEEIQFPEIEKIPLEVLVNIIKHEKDLTGWIKNIKAYAVALAKDGNLPGYKVVESRTNRKWNDALTSEEYPNSDEFIGASLNEHGVEEPFVCKLKNLGQVEKDLIEAGYSKKEARSLVDNYTTKPRGGPTLASEDDPRPVFEGAMALLTEEIEGQEE